MTRSKDVEPRVEAVLKDGQAYRDSDKRLLLEFWQREGLTLNQYQKDAFMRCTPAESITRARRDLKVKYPPSAEIDEKRYERFIEERDDHSTGKAVSWLND